MLKIKSYSSDQIIESWFFAAYNETEEKGKMDGNCHRYEVWVQLWAHWVNRDKHTNLYGFWHKVLSPPMFAEAELLPSLTHLFSSQKEQRAEEHLCLNRPGLLKHA